MNYYLDGILLFFFLSQDIICIRVCWKYGHLKKTTLFFLLFFFSLVFITWVTWLFLRHLFRKRTLWKISFPWSYFNQFVFYIFVHKGWWSLLGEIKWQQTFSPLKQSRRFHLVVPCLSGFNSYLDLIILKLCWKYLRRWTIGHYFLSSLTCST